MRGWPLLACLAATAGCGLVVEGVAAWDWWDDRTEDDEPTANTPPLAVVPTPPGPIVDRHPLAYVLADAEGDVADVAVDWSDDAGGSWNPASEIGGPPSEGATGLAAAPAGTAHVFVWDAYGDLGATDRTVRLRVRPSGGGLAGTPGVSLDVPVRNRWIVSVVGGQATPLAFPGGVAADASGNLYVADTFNHRVQVLNTQATTVTIAGVTIPAGQLGVVAGTGAAGFNGDNQAATSAQLNFPAGLALDGNGHLVVADALNHRIRRVDRTSGFITTLAGTGNPGAAGDNTLATTAELDTPHGCAFDGQGHLHVADTGNHVVRVVNLGSTTITVPPGGAAGVSVTPNSMRRWIGTPGTAGSSGDGAAATAALLNGPWTLCFVGAGHCYVADAGNHRVRAVNGSAAATVTLAGVAIAPGDIARLAGQNGPPGFSGDGGAATTARLHTVHGLAVDGNGNLVLADTGNSRCRVVNAQAATITLAGVAIGAGQIATVAGGGATPGPADGDGGAATAARLLAPEAVVVPGSGALVLADTGLGRVRGVNPGTGVLTVGTATIGAGNIGTLAGSVASVAPILRPAGVAAQGTGVFVADRDGHAVYRVDRLTGAVVRVAGTGMAGFAGDGAAATAAQLDTPVGLALDASGNCYIADWANNRVRVVNRQATTQSFHGVSIPAGAIDTVASGPASGPGSYTDSPDVALDASGNLYVLHRGQHRVRRLDGSGAVTTVTGGATGYGDGVLASAAFNAPEGLAVDGAGNFGVADTGNHAVRYVNLSASSVTVCGVVIAAGSVGTVAGIPPATGPLAGFNGDNQVGTLTRLDGPTAVRPLGAGHWLVADTGNARVRRLDGATGIVTTLCGTGLAGYNGDLRPAVNANLNAPTHLALDALGGCLVADSQNRRVRRFGP